MAGSSEPTVILVSPAEPRPLKILGESSTVPETYGADFLLTTPHGLVGIQRKEVRDLVASIRGDRIARELGQSSPLHQMVLLIEGDWRWDRDGYSRAAEGFTRPQFDGLLLAFQGQGWWVLQTATMAETIEVVRRVESWFQKTHHNSLAVRPKAGGLWGTHTNRDWARHLLQSFDGIGIEVAGAIYDHFGTVPLAWTVTEKELLEVPGVGKGRAAAVMKALDNREILETEKEAS